MMQRFVAPFPQTRPHTRPNQGLYWPDSGKGDWGGSSGCEINRMIVLVRLLAELLWTWYYYATSLTKYATPGTTALQG